MLEIMFNVSQFSKAVIQTHPVNRVHIIRIDINVTEIKKHRWRTIRCFI